MPKFRCGNRPVGGTLSDRLHPRLVMLVTDSVRAAGGSTGSAGGNGTSAALAALPDHGDPGDLLRSISACVVFNPAGGFARSIACTD